MYIVCGLGNPGKQYEYTRHNMGFRTIDVLSEKLAAPVKNLKFKALYGETRIGMEKVLLVKPQTFMNLSGEALREMLSYYKVEPEHIIVIYDDIDLPLGQLRVRKSGSSGTHNGMKSVIYQLQFDNFPRVRIGLGKNEGMPLDAFVVSKPPKEEEEVLSAAIKEAAEAVVTIIEKGIDEAMQKYNTKHAE